MDLLLFNLSITFVFFWYSLFLLSPFCCCNIANVPAVGLIKGCLIFSNLILSLAFEDVDGLEMQTHFLPSTVFASPSSYHSAAGM